MQAKNVFDMTSFNDHLPMKHVHPTSIIEFTRLVRIDLDRMVLIFGQGLIDPKIFKDDFFQTC